MNAFLLIKRATSDIKLIENRYQEKATTFLSKVAALRPGMSDLEGAVEMLLRLQAMYRLNPSEIANGVIQSFKTRQRMTPHDLFVIGEQA